MGSFSIILVSVLLATVVVDWAAAISEQDDATYAKNNNREKRQGKLCTKSLISFGQ